MLDIKEIEWAISQLEQEESSFQAYQKLASLYTIRDKIMGVTSHMKEPNYTSGYSQATPQDLSAVGRYGNSDFLKTVEGKDPSSAWSVMNDLMENLQVVNPRVYESVIRKLNRI